MKPTIGFYDHANTHPNATEFMIRSIRKFYPDAPIVISTDNVSGYESMTKQYNCIYQPHNCTLGPQTQPFGYRKDKAIEWLDRLHQGVKEMNTDFFTMMEDDVVILSDIHLEPEWEMVGHVLQYPGQVPAFPQALVDMIVDYSGVVPKKNYYTTGGGSFFKTSTFLENYDSVRSWLITHIDTIQDNFYPTLGWMDSYMTVFYLLCGKDLTENPRFYNIWPTKIPFDLSTIPPEYNLVHNFKNYY